MKRKVIQIADSTQLVSLPRKWAQKYGIKKGDEIDVEEKGNMLEIKSGHGQHMDRITVDFDKFSPLTAKCALDVLHKCGYDEIEINYTDKVIFKAIQERLSQFIGCDVVEQSDKRVLIKDITQGSLEGEFDSLFRRVFMVTLSMAKNSLNSIKKGVYSELGEYAVMESTNNKLVNYCQRILSKKGYKDPKKLSLYYTILGYLESIADDFRDLLNFISSEKDIKLSKEYIKMYEDITNYFQTFHDTFFKYNKESLDKLYMDRKKIVDQGIELFKARKDEPKAIWYILNIPHKLFDVLPIISGVSIN